MCSSCIHGLYMCTTCILGWYMCTTGDFMKNVPTATCALSCICIPGKCVLPVYCYVYMVCVCVLPVYRVCICVLPVSLVGVCLLPVLLVGMCVLPVYLFGIITQINYRRLFLNVVLVDYNNISLR